MNVVLISVDTLRADHMGIYGYHRSTTPFIDSFFADGVIFERCISQAPWTLPAHVSIFTGEYSSTHGALDKHECNLLDPATETFADVLHQAGYTTAAFTGGGFVSQEYGYHTFDVFDDSGKRNARNFAAMRRWITTKATEPFFLFWHEYWPHCPYTPPPEHDIFADPEYAGPIDVEPEPGGSHMAKRCGIYYQKMLPKLGPEDIQHIIDKYDGCIRQSDALVKRLIDTLGSEGLLDRTLVVFTSDHGESFADREHESRIGHHGMYEEVLRVPLLLWGPSLPMETPATVSKLVESIDIGPTILGQVGLSFSSEVAGTDLFAGAAGPTAYAEQFNFANRDELSVQTARQKVIHRTHRSDSTEEWEYYQLDQDPGEQRPLSTEQRDAQLLALANAVHELLPEEIRCGAAADIEDAKREELEALGYVVTTDGSKPD
jgi:arylsulfatase A-like enzyme